MLSIVDLCFGYRHRRLIDGLSLELRPRELLHLAGPNGAGKSTLLAVVAGLIKPQAGSIEYYPSTKAEGKAQDRREFLEYLPAEANGLYLKMDAMANLELWTKLRGRPLAPERLVQALGVWGLDHPLLSQGFAVEKFSTGMKRRLALARLSLSPAPCWLLDEPLYGLDAEAVVKFADMLAKHLAMGGMGLIVSHEIGAWSQVVSRTIRIGGGAER